MKTVIKTLLVLISAAIVLWSTLDPVLSLINFLTLWIMRPFKQKNDGHQDQLRGAIYY